MTGLAQVDSDDEDTATAVNACQSAHKQDDLDTERQSEPCPVETVDKDDDNKGEDAINNNQILPQVNRLNIIQGNTMVMSLITPQEVDISATQHIGEVAAMLVAATS